MSCLHWFHHVSSMSRNWRMLWCSLPRDKRLQVLLDMMKESNGEFKFAGIRVCSQAFQKLTRVSAGTLQNVRNKINQGVMNIWRRDSMTWLSIRNTPKALRYLDCRSWLETYAETHGERSPMSLQIFFLLAENSFTTRSTSLRGTSAFYD